MYPPESADILHGTEQQIRAAFAETPYPGDERVAAYARYGRSIADALRGKHWTEVELDVLHKHRWEIFLLTPETFRYYAPVFMLAALYHHDEIDSLPDNVLFSLTPQRDEHVANYFSGEHRDYFSRRAAAFVTEEKAAILAFVEGFAALYPQHQSIYDIDLLRVTIPFWRRA
ncbi:MAG: hypothetical protein JNJ61_01780 [Anaerolineae bacterium]|nr:hypothetical protein [Anaerolineae bacterium]